jgi:hypothetical protein
MYWISASLPYPRKIRNRGGLLKRKTRRERKRLHDYTTETVFVSVPMPLISIITLS